MRFVIDAGDVSDSEIVSVIALPALPCNAVRAAPVNCTTSAARVTEDAPVGM